MSKPNFVRYTGVALLVEGGVQVKRATRLTHSTDFNTERLLELANAGVSELVDSDTTSVTVECSDYGAVDNLFKLIGRPEVVSGSVNPAVAFRDTEFENAIVDFVVPFSDDDITIDYSLYLGSCYMTRYSANYSVDGTATETYEYTCSYKRWYLNALKSIRVYKADYSSATTAVVSGVNLNGQTGLFVTVGGSKVLDAKASDTITLTNNGLNTDVTGSPALTLSAGDRIRVLTTLTSTSFPALTTTPDGLGGVRRGFVDAYLYNSAGSEEKTLRAQSVGIDVSLDRTQLNELGRKEAYFQSLNRPIDIRLNVEFIATDLETLAKMSELESDFDGTTLTALELADFAASNILRVKIYNSETTHSAATLVKSLHFNSVGISTQGNEVTAGNNMNETIQFACDNLLVSGHGVSPFL